MTRISFDHHYDVDLGMFVFTSPDVQGFRATGKTIEEASREAVAVMSMLQVFRSDRIIKTAEYIDA